MGVIAKTRNILSDPKKWNKKSLARTKQGDICLARSEQAVKWCLIGAMDKVCGNNFEEWETARDIISSFIDVQNLVEFNDGRTTTHAKLMLVLDWATGVEAAGGL